MLRLCMISLRPEFGNQSSDRGIHKKERLSNHVGGLNNAYNIAWTFFLRSHASNQSKY